MKKKITVLALLAFTGLLLSVILAQNETPVQYSIEGFVFARPGQAMPSGIDVHAFNINLSRNITTKTLFDNGKYALIINGSANDSISMLAFNASHFGILSFSLPNAAGDITEVDGVNITFNQFPVVKGISFNDSSPKTEEDVALAFTYEDEDGNEGSITLSWFVNGSAVSTQKFSSIPNRTLLTSVLGSRNFSKTDIINASITINDTFYTVSGINTPQLHVNNSPPALSSLNLSSSAPKDDEGFNVSVTYSDPDSDPPGKVSITLYRIEGRPGLEGNVDVFENIFTGVANGASVTANFGANLFDRKQTLLVNITGADVDNASVQLKINIPVGNTAPKAFNLSISPAAPLTNSTLRLNYTYNDTDNETESGSAIKWFRNGTEQPSLSQSLTVSPALTAKGDRWSFSIKPKDGEDFGAERQSGETAIGNAPPDVNALVILPANATKLSSLSASYNFSDQDNDAESGSVIRWFKNGIGQPALENLTAVSNALFSKGDKFFFSLIPGDGAASGPNRSSPEITIKNAPPSAANLSITPANPDPTQDISASYTYQDPDTDAEQGSRLQWFKNGIEQPLLEGSAAVDDSLTAKGERWSFKVTPKDGADFGASAQSLNVTIGNTAPIIFGLSFNSTSVRTNDDVALNGTFRDDDGDPGTVFFQWFVNNNNVENDTVNISGNGAVTAVLKGTRFQRADKVNASVIASDGVAATQPSNSDTLTILNTAPTANFAEIFPGNPRTDDDLTATYSFNDQDGDPEFQSGILWFKDRTEQQLERDKKTISRSLTSKGEEWSFSVRPSDGFASGPSMDSGIVTILNTPPVVSNLQIAPQNPTTDNDLTASFTYSDADNDAQASARIDWFKDGSAQAILENRTVVNASLTEKGQRWSFSVLASDGTDLSELKQSGNITIGNLPPSASSPVFNNTAPKAGDVISVSANYSDPDGDNGIVNFTWFVNGIKVFTFTNNVQSGFGASSQLDPELFGKGDRINVSLKPGDNTTSGPSANSAAIIAVNTAPSASSPSISPAAPKTDDALSAAYNFTDPDSDFESGSEIRWFRNGIEQPALENVSSVNASFTSRGEAWSFSLRPGDGEELGILQQSPNVTVGNTPPAVSIPLLFAILTPPGTSTPILFDKQLKDRQDLASLTLYRDADNDTIDLTFRWLIYDPRSNLTSTLIQQFEDLPQNTTFAGANLSSSNYHKGHNISLDAVGFDGTDTSVRKSTLNITVGNTNPAASALTLSPLSPTTNDVLALNYTYDDIDNDTQSGSEFRWFKDGVEQLLLGNLANVGPVLTAKGQNWSFSVKPKDGEGFGAEQFFPGAIIGNIAPSASNAAIAPSSPNTNSNVNAVYNFSDTDSDADQSAIQWFRNGVEQLSLQDRKSLGPAELTKGDTWFFTLTPFDGDDEGVKLNSTNATVVNSAPSASGAKVSPSSPKTTSDLTAVYSFTDADQDGDDSELKWFKNSVEQVSLRNKTKVDDTLVKKGEKWHFTVTPFDGYDNGAMVQASPVTVLNTIPVVSSLKVSPSKPKDTSDLKATYKFTDADGDKENSKTQIKWYKNGKEQTKLRNKKVVDDKLTKKKEKWHFTVKPHDGQAFGSLKTSSKVTIA